MAMSMANSFSRIRAADAEFHGYEFEIGRVFQVAGGDLTLSYGLDSVSADFSDNSNVPRINPDRSIYQAAYARGAFDMQVVFKGWNAKRLPAAQVIHARWIISTMFAHQTPSPSRTV